MTKRRSAPRGPVDPAWYGEQEKIIAKAGARGAAARRTATDAGYLYVIEFSSGVVKVGKTTYPNGRIGSHAKNARIHGVTVARSWMSGKHSGHSIAEQELIAFGKRSGTPLTSGRCEYFTDLDFESAQRFARTLVDDRLRAAHLAELFGMPAGDVDLAAVQRYAEEQAELVRQRQSEDAARLAYLALRIEAVNGDMGATWAEAEAALEGEAA